MTTNITQRTGANGLQSAFAASSAATFSVSTADPSLSTTLAPVLTVVLGFGKHAGLQAVPRGAAIPHQPPKPPHAEERASDLAGTGGAASGSVEAGAAEGSSADVVKADSDSPDVAEAEGSFPALADAESSATNLPPEGSSSSEDGAHERASESSTSRHRDRRPRLVDAAAVPAEAESESTAAAPEPMAAEPPAESGPAAEAQPAAEPQAVKPAPSNRLEMTIDSLPHHDLTAPIPIYIDPLGDTVFTATVANLDIMATGNSIGEALVLLKEQIEFIYGDLNRRQKPSPEQMTMLKVLNTYIAPKGTKPSWL